MSEDVTLHGGPMHGSMRTIESGSINEISVTKYEAPIESVDAPLRHIRRLGKYTRVHTLTGKATKDFEWQGWRN